ncbi:MAG: hypothetical protein OEZ01_13680 [Candidatus Heimdallarchaeota archaeon]|nr:hypothetical protein [Candidatus Heimdallarchaeota archaeon]MDH5647057.1 hypothetical protein [Candidatus Heimdallarchaeota archaeon]
MIISNGIINYHYNPNFIDVPKNINESLFSGLISAINSFAQELGEGNLHTLVLGEEKIVSRLLKSGDDILLLIVTDKHRVSDDIIRLKSEYVFRVLQCLIPNYQDIHIIEDPFTPQLKSLSVKETNNLFKKIVNEYNTSNLVKLLRKLENPNKDFEKSLNILFQELPSSDIIYDDALIVVENKIRTIVVPYDLDEHNQMELVVKLRNKITPILGERFTHKVLEKFIENK